MGLIDYVRRHPHCALLEKASEALIILKLDPWFLWTSVIHAKQLGCARPYESIKLEL